MNTEKRAALASVTEEELVAQVADAVWDYAGLSMQEVKSAACSSGAEGRGLSGGGRYAASPPSPPPSAAAKPVIGLLAGTMRCPAFRRRRAAPWPPRAGKGQQRPGCSHNLPGAGRPWLPPSAEALSARPAKAAPVICCGCPGERSVASKAYMAREGSVVRAGRSADVAPRRQQRGDHRLHQLLHPDDPVPGLASVSTALERGAQRAGRSGAVNAWACSSCGSTRATHGYADSILDTQA